MKNSMNKGAIWAFFILFLMTPSCKGEGTGQLPVGTGLESENAGSGIVLNDKQNEEGPDAQPGIQVASNTQGGPSGNPPVDDDQKYIKVRTGTPTLGGQHCPAGSAMGENANDTMGNVAIAGNNKHFTCTITFSTPYPKGPICVITGSGWVTPPDMTFKINATSAEIIEVSGVTQTDPLAGYVFNYICL